MYAVYTREQFYPTILYLVTSKVSYVVGGNMVFAIAFFIAHFLKSIFLGTLSESEHELLADRAKYTVVETCLALTIFRSELTPAVVCYFGGLLFLNAFHWLAKGRIERLDQVMPTGCSKHIRLLGLLGTLFAIDMWLCYQSVSFTVSHGKSVMILFSFEFGLLIVSIFNMTWRYLFHGLDTWLTHGLTSKGLYIMLVDLVCDAMRFVTYIFFFGLVFVYYGMPIYLVRELWTSFYLLQRNVSSFIKYLRLTHNLDQRFPDATDEELAAVEDCLICREPMTAGKKLPCGHIFHLPCLRVWLQHQQWCPLCRADIPVHSHGDTPAIPAEAAAAEAGAGAGGELPLVGAAAVGQPGHGAQLAPAAAAAAAAAAEGGFETAPVRPAAETASARQDAYHAHRMHDSPHDAAHRLRGSTLRSPSTSPPHPAAGSGTSTVASQSWTRMPPESLPRFFTVTSVVCAVHLEPAASSGVVRTILQGTVIFVQDIKTEGPTTAEWARIPDGWVWFRASGSASPTLTAYDPSSEYSPAPDLPNRVMHTTSSSSTTSTPSQLAAHMYSPFTPLSAGGWSAGQRSRGAGFPTTPGGADSASSKSSACRVERMLHLQERLRVLSDGVSAIKHEMGAVQMDLSLLVEEELCGGSESDVDGLPPGLPDEKDKEAPLQEQEQGQEQEVQEEQQQQGREEAAARGSEREEPRTPVRARGKVLAFFADEEQGEGEGEGGEGEGQGQGEGEGQEQGEGEGGGEEADSGRRKGAPLVCTTSFGTLTETTSDAAADASSEEVKTDPALAGSPAAAAAAAAATATSASPSASLSPSPAPSPSPASSPRESDTPQSVREIRARKFAERLAAEEARSGGG